MELMLLLALDEPFSEIADDTFALAVTGRHLILVLTAAETKVCTFFTNSSGLFFEPNS